MFGIEFRCRCRGIDELKAMLDEIASDLTAEIDQLSASIANLKGAIMATKDEVLADLTAIATTVTKIGTETSASLQKITELEALIAQGGVSQDIVDKVAEIKASVTAVDDLVTDAPTPTP